jgi:hypothetical protein
MYFADNVPNQANLIITASITLFIELYAKNLAAINALMHSYNAHINQYNVMNKNNIELADKISDVKIYMKAVVDATKPHN